MYAVIETGGKQYRVSPGDTVEVELLPAEPGATVTLERVLLVSDDGSTRVGQPTVAGGAVVGRVIGEGRGKKIIVFRYKSKKRYRRTTGHRQDYTYLTVTDIQANGESLVADEDRKRYERQAQRAVNRYERRLVEALASLIGAVAEEMGVSPDEVGALDLDDSETAEDAAPAVETAPKPTRTTGRRATADASASTATETATDAETPKGAAPDQRGTTGDSQK